MVVANYYNDSITVFTGGLGNWTPLSTLTAEEPGGAAEHGGTRPAPRQGR